MTVDRIPSPGRPSHPAPSAPLRRVVIVGAATIDYIEQPDNAVVKMGGVTIYAGLTFRQHGLCTTVVTNIAPGDEALVEAFRRQRIEILNGATDTTTLFVNYTDGDDRWQEMPSSAAPITAAQCRAVLSVVDHVHLGPLHPDDLEIDLLQLLAREEISVSLDLQGYVRHVENGRVLQQVSPHLEEALRCAAVVKAEQSELDAVLGAYRMDLPTLMRTYGLREVLVTMGSRGGCIVVDGLPPFRYGARQVPRPVDTTGAGDVFFAAYLVARFHEGRGVREACEHAAEVAARHVGGLYIPPAWLALHASGNGAVEDEVRGIENGPF